MCEYCEKHKEIKSCNFGERARIRILGDSLDIFGDKKKIKWLENIYAPRFIVSYCPMCGRKLNDNVEE